MAPGKSPRAAPRQPAAVRRSAQSRCARLRFRLSTAAALPALRCPADAPSFRGQPAHNARALIFRFLRRKPLWKQRFSLRLKLGLRILLHPSSHQTRSRAHFRRRPGRNRSRRLIVPRCVLCPVVRRRPRAAFAGRIMHRIRLRRLRGLHCKQRSRLGRNAKRPWQINGAMQWPQLRLRRSAHDARRQAFEKMAHACTIWRYIARRLSLSERTASSLQP